MKGLRERERERPNRDQRIESYNNDLIKEQAGNGAENGSDGQR